MPKAVVDFDFKIHPNLQVDFINNTEGVVDSYLWNFGFLESGIIKTYIGAVPPTITFPNAGTFPVILTATNSFGDALIEKDIVVADEPTLGLSILDLVKVDLLGSVNITGIQEYLGVLIRKWQLYLKDPLNISNDNVFNESVWPNFANILIAKLVIWDLLLVTQRGLLISQDFNAGNNANVLTDYTLQSIPIYSISILSVVMNNLEMAISYPVINDDAGLLAFLNSQGWGTFILDGSIIKSIANTNDLVSLKYNVVGISRHILHPSVKQIKALLPILPKLVLEM